MAGISGLSRLLLKHFTTPSAPPAGSAYLYPRSDDRMYLMTSEGVERQVTDTRLVRVATTAAFALTGIPTSSYTDGVTVANGDRVLVRMQGWSPTVAADNGIYVVNSGGAWTRAADANTAAKLAFAQVMPTEGTRYAGCMFGTDFKPTDTLGTTGVGFSAARIETGTVFGSGHPTHGGMYFNTTDEELIVANGVGWSKIAREPAGVIKPYGGFAAPSGYLLCNGAAASRTTYADLWAALTYSFTGTGANGSSYLDTADTTYAEIGMVVEGAGLAPGTTITGVVDGDGLGLSSTFAGAGSGTYRLVPHGGGDGSTTFNLPDLRGRTPVGTDASSDFERLGMTGGHKDMQAHDHNGATGGQSASHTHRFTWNYVDTTQAGAAQRRVNAIQTSGGLATTDTGAASGNHTHSVATDGTGDSGNLQPYLALNYIIKT